MFYANAFKLFFEITARNKMSEFLYNMILINDYF